MPKEKHDEKLYRFFSEKYGVFGMVKDYGVVTNCILSMMGKKLRWGFTVIR
ncbi:MAG: hypothetical protein K6E75_03140 [Lachnospiraceae bacterium]|nr:hypothetical protein [Lachnospiraceae bacterium]